MAVFKGNTSGGREISKQRETELAPFLSAEYWRKGVKVSFIVLGVHRAAGTYGPYISAQLVLPAKTKTPATGDTEFTCVRIGNLAGITLARMQALDGAKNKNFVVGDRVFLKCTGISKAKEAGHSDSPDFEMEIDREEDAPEKTAETAAA